MKRLLLLLIVCVLIESLVGCGKSKTISVNVEKKDDLSSVVFGIKSLIEIGDGLWYDSSTRVVYWWNGHFIKSSYDTTLLHAAAQFVDIARRERTTKKASEL